MVDMIFIPNSMVSIPKYRHFFNLEITNYKANLEFCKHMSRRAERQLILEKTLQDNRIFALLR